MEILTEPVVMLLLLGHLLWFLGLERKPRAKKSNKPLRDINLGKAGDFGLKLKIWVKPEDADLMCDVYMHESRSYSSAGKTAFAHSHPYRMFPDRVRSLQKFAEAPLEKDLPGLTSEQRHALGIAAEILAEAHEDIARVFRGWKPKHYDGTKKLNGSGASHVSM